MSGLGQCDDPPGRRPGSRGEGVDDIVYAAARRFEGVVWTQDDDFKDLPDVRYSAKWRERHNLRLQPNDCTRREKRPLHA